MKHCLYLALLLAGLSTGCASTSDTFAPLFNGKDLAGWSEIGSKGSWSVQDGVLKCNGKKDGYAWLCTDRKYGDFVLECDWRIYEKTNSGIFCRVPQKEGRASMLGFEIQIMDDNNRRPEDQLTGSLFQRADAGVKAARPVGEWNRYEITCIARHVRVVLNGVIVNDVDMNAIASMKDVPAEGYIGLQNHDTPVDFRNVRIRELKMTPAK